MGKSFFTILVLIFICIAVASCRKTAANNDAVKLDNFTNRLQSENPDCICEPHINKYSWRNQTIFVLAYKGPACDWMPVYYNQNLTEIKMETGYSFDNFLQESQFINNSWNCQ